MINISLWVIQLVLLTLGYGICVCVGESALVAYLNLLVLLANLLVLKSINLMGLSGVTACDAYAVVGLIILNTIQRQYGKQSAMRAILVSMFMLLITAAVLWIHIQFEPNVSDKMHPTYMVLIANLIPVLLLSLMVFIITQWVDYSLYAWLLSRYPHAPDVYRQLASLSITQALDTALFTWLALDGWGLHLWSVFLFSYALKILVILATTPMLSWVYEFAKRFNVKHLKMAVLTSNYAGKSKASLMG